MSDDEVKQWLSDEEREAFDVAPIEGHYAGRWIRIALRSLAEARKAAREGARQERERIVAWLHAQKPARLLVDIDWVADAIEADAHDREGT